MEIGTARGLAQDLQYDQRIADSRYQNLQLNRAKAINEAGLKAFEDDMDYMNAANSFDHNLIKQEADKTAREIGTIMRTNPDWQYNPDVRRQINEKKKYIKSNNHVLRGMASDEAFNNLNKDLAQVAKNPAMHDSEAYQALLAQKNNYIKFGNQNGEEALKTEGVQPFVYTKPQDFVPLNEEALKTAGLIKARKYKSQGNGGYEELVDEDALTPAAMDFYNRHKRQIQVTYNPKDDSEGIAYAKELIRPGIDLKRKFGEPHYNDALAVKKWEYAQQGNQGQNKTIDAYRDAVVSKRYNKLPTESVTAMLGLTPEAKIYDADGGFKGTSKGQKFIPSGDYGQANTVKQGANGKWGLASNSTIGVAHGYIEMSEGDYDNSGYDNDPKMRDKVVVKEITTPKGKKENVYWIPAQVEFDPNDEAKRFKFNNHVGMTNKQITGLNPLQQANQQQIFEDEVGNLFTQDSNGNTIPYTK